MNPHESIVLNELNNPNEEFDYFYKIIDIGDEGVGKTNYLLGIAKNYYNQPELVILLNQPFATLYVMMKNI